MALTFTQTDNVSNCDPFQACAPAGTTASPVVDVAMVDGGTPGTTAESFDIPAASSVYGAFFQSGAIAKETWEGGTWTVNLNVSSAQNNTTWSGVWICRVSGSGASCTSHASIGSETTSTDISAGGVFSKTVTGAETTRVSETDTVYVICEFSNSHSMTSRTVGITPNETVASPITAPTSAQTITVDGPATLTTTSPTPTVSPGVSGVSPPSAGLTTTSPTPTVSNQITIDGTVLAPDETTQSGATVSIVNSDTATFETELTTDGSGAFSATVPGGTYHVSASYDDGGGNQYNAISEPLLTSPTTLTINLEAYTAPTQDAVAFSATTPSETIAPPVVGLTTTTPTPTVTPGVSSVSPPITSLTTTTATPSLSPGVATVAPSVMGISTTTPAPTADPGVASLSPVVVGLSTSTPVPSVSSGTAIVSGTFTYNGTVTSGATVRGINDTTGAHQGTDTTDANGDYAIEFPTGDEGHMLIEFTDPDTSETITAESKPFIVTQ